MVYIFLSLGFYSLAMLVAAYANRNANVGLVALIVNAMSISVPALLLLTSQQGDKTSTKAGLFAAVIGGVLISIFTLALGKAYEQNNVAVIGPIVFGGSIVVTSVASYFLFKEKIGLMQGFGLLLVTVGLAIVVYSKYKS